MKTREELRAQFMRDLCEFSQDGHADPDGMALDELLKEWPEPLSDDLREKADVLVNGPTAYPEWIVLVGAELLRRCPAPPRKPRTAEELAEDIAPYLSLTGYALPALQELVALAKRAEAGK